MIMIKKRKVAFKARLEDRFGKVPPEGLELLRIVPLRRLAKRLETADRVRVLYLMR